MALIFLNIILIIIGLAFGDLISDYFYYNVFHKVDPFQGATLFRVRLILVSQGILIAFLIFTRIKIFLVKRKVYFYFFLYFILVLIFIIKVIYYNYFIYGVIEKFDLISYILYFVSIDFLLPINIIFFSFLSTIGILNLTIILSNYLMSCPTVQTDSLTKK